MAPTLVDLTAEALRPRLFAALEIYTAAMGYPPSTAGQRAPLWAEHLLRPGFCAVGAFAPVAEVTEPDGSKQHPAGAGGTLVGFAYGYRGGAGHWWGRQVREELLRRGADPAATDALFTNYFELTELHVHPQAQGAGVGHALLERLLSRRTERHVLLSTPEIPGEDNRAWRLYRRAGFGDVLRNYHFAGDARPFAVLGRGGVGPR